ncbi:hypothetical protein CCACVL1_09375 [Corchorus capsularis]|uniref:Uncharacterized protein n=1 Tax=Corchorus capsularis TaxID=210143 RepID=A0A1R3IWH4_COCAP|nr:hypothetical protein CCACVL1_09375 [Corchorus capsularis]
MGTNNGSTLIPNFLASRKGANTSLAHSGVITFAHSWKNLSCFGDNSGSSSNPSSISVPGGNANWSSTTGSVSMSPTISPLRAANSHQGGA